MSNWYKKANPQYIFIGFNPPDEKYMRFFGYTTPLFNPVGGGGSTTTLPLEQINAENIQNNSEYLEAKNKIPEGVEIKVSK